MSPAHPRTAGEKGKPSGNEHLLDMISWGFLALVIAYLVDDGVPALGVCVLVAAAVYIAELGKPPEASAADYRKCPGGYDGVATNDAIDDGRAAYPRPRAIHGQDA